MNYVIMDLEWNQSNTGKEPEAEKLPFEIIEIGAIKLNSEFTMVSQFSQLVKPTVYKKMHHITSRLIHMRMEELETGKPFPEVMEEFLEWCGEEEFTFCTWGPLDLTELQRNLKFFGLSPIKQGPIAFYDVQKLFSIAFEDRKSRRSLEWAVDYLGLEKDIPFHRAFGDAYYTGKILARLQGEKVWEYLSYDTFYPPRSRKEEVHIRFDTYAKYISRAFKNKQSAMADREVASSKCYECHRNLKKKVRWFTVNGRHYFSLAYCEKHGWLKYKLRFYKSFGEEVFVVKTAKRIGGEDAQKLLEKRERAKAHVKKRVGKH